MIHMKVSYTYVVLRNYHEWEIEGSCCANGIDHSTDSVSQGSHWFLFHVCDVVRKLHNVSVYTQTHSDEISTVWGSMASKVSSGIPKSSRSLSTGTPEAIQSTK